ncbi:hypothetical protein FOZ63_007022, partial [Perkinsus olseni]
MVHWSQLTLWYGICGIAVSLIVLLVGRPGSTLPYLREANSWSIFMLILVGCISFTGQTFFNIGLQLTSSAVTSSIVRQMDVVFGFIFQIFIQHHPSTATNVAGADADVVASDVHWSGASSHKVASGVSSIPSMMGYWCPYIRHGVERLIYQLRYDPRRVLDLTLLLVSLFVEWCGTALVAPLTPWLVQALDPSMDEGSAASIFMASFSIGTLIASLVTGPLSDRYGRRPVFIWAMFLYTISYFLVANAWSIASFAGFRALGGVSAGTRPVLYAFITDSSRQEDMRFY